MSAQEALWNLPNQLGGWWWLLCSAMAIPAAVMIMVRMVINEPFSLLTTARTLIAASMFAFGMIPLNSGFLPWAVLLTTAGGLLSSILIITNWCNRPDQSLNALQTIWRWITTRKNGRNVAHNR